MTLFRNISKCLSFSEYLSCSSEHFWGCPGLQFHVFFTTFSCWLSVMSGAIWAFVGPGLFIIFVSMSNSSIEGGVANIKA